MKYDKKYNNEEHLKLIEQSLNLKKQNKLLSSEDYEASMRLIHCQIYLQDHIFWLKKNDFVSLMLNYIENSITFEEFEKTFSSL